jgi:hypothetical protein
MSKSYRISGGIYATKDIRRRRIPAKLRSEDGLRSAVCRVSISDAIACRISKGGPLGFAQRKCRRRFLSLLTGYGLSGRDQAGLPFPRMLQEGREAARARHCSGTSATDWALIAGRQGSFPAALLGAWQRDRRIGVSKARLD